MPLSRRHKKTKRLKKRFNKKLQKTKRLNKRGGAKSLEKLPPIEEVDENNEEINNSSSPRTPREPPVVYDLGAAAAAADEVHDNDYYTIFIDYDVIVIRRDDIKDMEYINIFLSQMKKMYVNVVIYIKPYNLEIDISGKDKLPNYITIINPKTLLSQEDEAAQAQNIIKNMTNNLHLQQNEYFYSSKRSMFISDDSNIVEKIEEYVNSDKSNLKGLNVIKPENKNYIEIIIMIIEHLKKKYIKNISIEKYLIACLQHWTDLLNRSKNGGKRRNSTSKKKYR